MSQCIAFAFMMIDCLELGQICRAENSQAFFGIQTETHAVPKQCDLIAKLLDGTFEKIQINWRSPSCFDFTKSGCPSTGLH